MLTRRIPSLLELSAALICALTSHAQLFSNQANALGIDAYNVGIFGSGVSVHDWNKDGWDDITVTMPGEGIRFYQNSFGEFELVDFGLQGLSNVKQICWVDYDNDGDKDLFVNQLQASLKLFNNQGNFEFVDVTESANLSTESNDGYGASWGDIDNDGNLDLYVCNYFFEDETQTNHFYYNMGDGTFMEGAVFLDINNGLTPTFQSVFFDYDQDGDQDIFVANDRYNYTNYLYRNNGDNFEDVSGNLNVDDAIWSMCATVDDYDNDADLDIYITNNQFGNILHQNQDGEIFLDVAIETNTVLYAHSWGSIFFDVNNDGWKDLYVASSPLGDEYPGYHHLFINNQGSFVSPGVTGFGLSNEPTYSAAKGDFNNDGYVDFITLSDDPLGAEVWVNTGGASNYIKVGLEGVVSNRDGIGATVRAWIQDEDRSEYVMCGEGYLSQHSQYEHFGLENNQFVDSLKVYWLSGHVDSYYNVEVNQTLQITEGAGIDASVTSNEGNNPCYGTPTVLSTADFEIYQWSTGEQTAQIEVTETGFYWVTGTTPQGLVATSDSIFIEFLPESQIATESGNITCHGGLDGWINIYAESGPGLYEVIWNEEFFGTYEDGLPAGSFSYEALDSVGCFHSGEIWLNEPAPLVVDINTEEVSCFGDADGQATAQINGGTPGYVIDWKGADPNELAAGSYFVVVTDTLGCELAVEYEVFEPDPISISLNVEYVDGLGVATVNPEGGTPPYEINWGEGNSGLSIDELTSGDYEVIVTDSLGCIATEVFIITDLPQPEEQTTLVMPNPFEDIIKLQFKTAFTGHLQLIDVNGRVVHSERIGSSSSHQILTSHLPSGSYSLKVGDEVYQMVKH